ncbi:MAG: phosphohistidine phosphatase SixA [Opitutales bacterium]
MQVFLIRHAHAVDAAEDVQRPLSRRGRKQVRKLARFLKDAAEFQPDEIWTSPLARAQETAGRLQHRLGLTAPLRSVGDLATAGGVTVLATRLRKSSRTVALVGHEPHLSALASLLVSGAIDPSRFELKKGAILALERTGNRWIVNWLIHPDLL